MRRKKIFASILSISMFCGIYGVTCVKATNLNDMISQSKIEVLNTLNYQYDADKPFNKNGDLTIIGTSPTSTLKLNGFNLNPIYVTNGTLTINNMIIEDEVEGTESNWKWIYPKFAGNVVFENCTFKNGISITQENCDTKTSATFKNCTFNGGVDEYGIWIYSGDVTFDGCTFKKSRVIKFHTDANEEKAYVGTALIDDCKFYDLTEKPAISFSNVHSSAKITVKNSIFDNCAAGEQNKYIYEGDTDVLSFTFENSDNTIVSSNITSVLSAAIPDNYVGMNMSMSNSGYTLDIPMQRISLAINTKGFSAISDLGIITFDNSALSDISKAMSLIGADKLSVSIDDNSAESNFILADGEEKNYSIRLTAKDTDFSDKFSNGSVTISLPFENTQTPTIYKISENGDK